MQGRLALISALPVLCAAFSPSSIALSSAHTRGIAAISTRPPSAALAALRPSSRVSLRGGAAFGLRMAASAPERAVFKQAGYRRPLHWVFKIGSLDKSMKFYEDVFGMKVHRHEEFASGCEATCNGPYGGAWSKTMIGYEKEETNFALELTYNYGIDSYQGGNDYRYIALRASNLKADPATLGYPVSTDDATGERLVEGPDGYKYMIVDTDEGDAKEPFLFVSINVADVAKSTKYYTEVLGATKMDTPYKGAQKTAESVMLSMGDGSTKLELVQLPKGAKVDHALASGRFATETEDGAPFYMAEKVKSAGNSVLHGPIKLQPHNEEVAIVDDLDGYEFCFVDARGYTNCVNVAYEAGGTSIDYDFRARLEAASMSKNPKLEVAKVLAKDYNVKEVAGKVQGHIDSAPVVVFSQTSCPFCKKAKELLDAKGAKYITVEVDALGDEGYAFRVELDKVAGSGTVPQIFLGGGKVGGFSDLEGMDKDGKLDEALKTAGAL